MRGKSRPFVEWFLEVHPGSGKITLAAVLGVALVSVTTLGAYLELKIPVASAANVSTAVTVLNTPPVWTVDAQESTESSTSTPTNAGSVLSFVATATDSGGDNYWLLICSASSTPVAHNSAPPTCGSGIQWARSATTTSGSQATAATTTIEMTPFNNESNAWYAYICDGNSTGALCNGAMKQGSGTTVSPFVIDHPPVFKSITNPGAANPGGTVTWTATAYTTDTIRGSDTVKLFVCRLNDFLAASSSCGAGGTVASSTFVSSNPATTTTITIPTQDQNYNAYVFITNNFNLAATSTYEGFNDYYTVNHVTPTISAASITLNDPRTLGNLTLITPASTSGPFTVKFTVASDNSCLSASSTNEIASVKADVYRSGVTQASCQLSGDYNSNSCYPYASPYTGMTCVQDVGSCTGASDTTATFTCTFNYWYNADPTDTGSVYAAQNWLASASSTNWKGDVSSLVETSNPNELVSFLAFGVTQSSISYGGLQPGSANDPLATTTNLVGQGNIGLDETLYGDTMCTTWSSADSCDVGGPNAATKIPVANQKFATSSVSYATGTALTGSTTPSTLLIHVQKTTSTSSPQTKNTYWGIQIPGSITLSGNYSGQNTITAVESNSAFW